jgi:hypothetical protein
MLRWVS